MPCNLHKCPNCFGKSMKHKVKDEFVYAELPCKRNTCPFCFSVKRDIAIDAINGRMNTTEHESMYIYTIHGKKEWERCNRYINRKDGRYISIDLSADKIADKIVEFEQDGKSKYKLMLSDEKYEAVICSTVKPPKIASEPVGTMAAAEILVRSLSGLGDVQPRRRPYNSSREWAIKNEDQDKESMYESLGNSRKTADAVEAILKESGFDTKRHNRGDNRWFWSTVNAKMTKEQAVAMMAKIRYAKLADAVSKPVENPPTEMSECIRPSCEQNAMDEYVPSWVVGYATREEAWQAELWRERMSE